MPRVTRAAAPVVVLALCAILVGLVGNILIDPAYVRVFALYASAAVLVVGVMLYRARILRMTLAVTDEAGVIPVGDGSVAIFERDVDWIYNRNAHRG